MELNNLSAGKTNNATSGSTFPGFRSYLSETRRIGHFLTQGDWPTVWNRSRGLAINIWNFQVKRNQVHVECPCCGWQGPAFLYMSTWRSIEAQSKCPRCQSRSRHRGLTLLLPDVLGDKPAGPGLVFAPEPSMMNLLERLITESVMTTDLNKPDVHFPGEDIQRLSFEDGRFAFLMCNHVLEHIPDDNQALRECARILMPEGLAVFTIPGDFDKYDTWYFDKPDSTGHMRHYGMDVVEKMIGAGFSTVTPIDMSKDRPPRYYIRPRDMAFICRK